MHSITQDRRATLPTISTTRPAVERYWTGYAPSLPASPKLNQILPPLDGHLIHLVLHVSSQGQVVYDLAAETTAGTTSVVALQQGHTRSVVVTWTQANIVSALKHFRTDESGGAADLAFRGESTPPADHRPDAESVVIVNGDRPRVGELVQNWLKAQPKAVILILGVGLVGECAVLEELLAVCGANSDRRLWLARELAEALCGSRLAIVANSQNSNAAGTVARLASLYRGNTSFLDLLWGMNRQAIRTSEADRRALEEHGNAAPVLHEIAELKRKLAHVEAEASLEKLAHLTNEIARLREIETTIGYRAQRKFNKIRRWFFPDNGWFHRKWLFLRRQGLRGILRRMIGRKPA